jgi:hypothetical protein
MTCDSILNALQTAAQRKAEIQAAFLKLEAAMMKSEVTITIGQNGAIAFAGWSATDRGGVTDVCAYRKLTVARSFALKQAVMRAEAMSGRKVNEKAIAMGTHSHDNGVTWSKGH